MESKSKFTPEIIQIGMSHGMAKLTDSDVLLIRASELSGIYLAKKYGVCSATISNVRNRVIWKHI